MGKNDFLTPKAIANRIKAKGLQKLRWYCQLCRKQCRDENGFKCHQMSESHRRQFELFGHNPDRFVDGFSEEFEQLFLDHMRRSHPYSRVSANIVYNEFISDRHHIHMNSTKWLTLTEFVKYLGRTGKCKVDETPKGWFIRLVPRDDIKSIQTGKKRKWEEQELEDDERQLKELDKQIQKAKGASKADESRPEATDLVRDRETGPLVFSVPGLSSRKLGHDGKKEKGEKESGPDEFLGLGGEERGISHEVTAAQLGRGGEGSTGKKGLSKLEGIMREEIAAKSKRNSMRLDHWLHRGIVVKVLSKELREHGYYKEKGVVERVVDKYVGEIRMLQSGDIIRVDQEQLETVLPQLGGPVLIVNGACRGEEGTLLALDTDKYKAKVQVQKGTSQGQTVWADYEDICKIRHSG